jgi:CRP-like cAMP-binding protein
MLTVVSSALPARPRPAPCERSAVATRIAESLEILGSMPIQRHIVHAGDRVYQAGEHFVSLHIVHSGFFKAVNLAADGREQVVSLHFKGDWLGFDGIADQRHYLGMVLESVSRALSRLAREQLIRFAGAGRRHVQIPDLGALADFVEDCMTPAPRALQ